MKAKTAAAALFVMAGAVLTALGQSPSTDKPTLRKAMSQAEAVRQPLGSQVTVEFQVGTATMARYSELKATDKEESRLVFLAPVDSLPGGDRFEAILCGKAVTHLNNLNLLGDDRPDKFFAGQLLRVTGKLEAIGPNSARTYRVMVPDLEGLEIVRPKIQ